VRDEHRDLVLLVGQEHCGGKRRDLVNKFEGIRFRGSTINCLHKTKTKNEIDGVWKNGANGHPVTNNDAVDIAAPMVLARPDHSIRVKLVRGCLVNVDVNVDVDAGASSLFRGCGPSHVGASHVGLCGWKGAPTSAQIRTWIRRL